MEAEETLPHATKRSRNNVKVLLNEGRQHTATTEEDDDVDEEEDEGGGGGTGGEDEEEGEEDTKQLSSSWQTQQQPMQLQMLHPHPSRIFRVSRASGGKDRHSKVLTAKGLRDRRVRLSVATAIQFYDLQDRLGFDQPSKAVDWLIKAAADAIAELPSLEGTLFHRLPPAGNDQDPAKPLPLISRSACSSTSETSRGSVLSLSRSEIRVKARERARERAKDKVVTVTVATTATTTSAEEVASQKCNNSQQHRPPYSSSSFTDLLMDLHSQHPGFPSKTSNKHPVSLKKPEPPPMLPPVLDYFNTNAAASVFSQGKPQTSLVMPSPNLVNSAQLMSSAPLNPPCDLGLVDHHPELQQFAFLQGNHVPVANSNDYNCFAAGSNRGTLQSNSSALMSHHHHHHLQKFAPPFSNNQGASPGLPFFIGQTQATGGSQFQTGFDARLHLYYSDGCRHTDLKEEGRS